MNSEQDPPDIDPALREEEARIARLEVELAEARAHLLGLRRRIWRSSSGGVAGDGAAVKKPHRPKKIFTFPFYHVKTFTLLPHSYSAYRYSYRGSNEKGRL